MENKIKSIKLKIEESNHFQIQRESVLLIHQLLLNEKSQQIFDTSLNIFLQLIYSPYVHVIETTIECIINLVKIKRVTREIILNKLLESIVSIDKSMVGLVVKAIFTLSIDIEYMSKIIKELNGSGKSNSGSGSGNIVYTLNTLTKQFSISRPEIYESISEEVELILLDTQIPPSLREQRFDFLKPILSNLLLNSSELPIETSLLHNTLVRIAHDVPNLYQPVLSFLTSLLFLYSNNSNNNISQQQQFNQKVQFIRDLIDLIRFPPSSVSANSSLSSKEFNNEFSKSILSILYYLLNIFVNSKQINQISVRNNILVHLQELILLDPCIVWYQSFNSSLNNYNTPIIVVLLLFLPSSVSSIQQKILELLRISLDYLPTKITNNNQYSIITSLRLSVSPLIRMISVSSSNNHQHEIYKKLLKDIEVLISNISLKVDNKEYINSSSSNKDEDDEESINKSSDKMINLDNSILLDNFIVINLAWNLLLSNRNGELVYGVLPTWLNILNSNLKLNQIKLNEKEKLEKKQEQKKQQNQQQPQQITISLNSSVEFSNEFLIYFLSPFLIFKNNKQDQLASEIRIEAIHLLPIIARRPIESISVIPLFFYAIQREEKSQVMFELFETLPELAKNKDCFASVLKILSNLDQQQQQQQQKKQDSSATTTAKSSILPSFILRIYCKLWKVNSLVFPKIEELIYSVIQQIQNNNEDYNEELFENKLSTILTIKDICEFEPNQGQELIQPLSQFLCKEVNPTLLTLALESLSSLCKYEIISFTSAWNVIKKHLGQEEGFENDKRSSMVLVSLLEFFSNGAIDFSGQSNLEQKTIDVITDIIRRVWNLSSHQDNVVSSNAYLVLSNYIKVLENQELLEKIQSKIPLLLERLGNLSKGDNVDSNFVLLLNSLLERELNEKRSLKTAHQNIKQTKSISIFNNNNDKLLKIMELLEDELDQESRTGIKSGIILGLLWFNSNNSDGSNEAKKETKKEILMNFKFNKSLLNDSIEFLDNSRDLLSKLMSLGAWGRFMNECFTAYEKNDIMRQSLPSGTKLSSKETHEKIFDELQDQLLETIKSNPSSIQAENSIFALVMMSRNLSRVCYSKMEFVFNQLLQWVTDQKSLFSGNADIVFGAAYLGLGILAPCLLADSNLIKEAISALEFSATSNESNLNENIKFNCYLALGICSSQLANNQFEKKRINLILYNSFLNYFGNSNGVKINESMTLSGLCLAIGYSSNSFEELSMNDNLSKIYEIIQNNLLNNQQFINDCPLSYGFTLISFASIVSSCFKLNIISSDEIKSKILPFYQNTSSKSSNYQCIGFNNLIQSLLRQGYTDFDLPFIESILISNKKVISDSNNSSSLDKINSILSTSILLGSPILSQSVNCLDSTLESYVLDFINSQPSSRKDFKQLLDEIIDSMVKLFENSTSDSKTIRYTSICLGSITLPINNKRNSTTTTSTSTNSQEPENYDHLPNELLIKNLFNYLISSSSLPKKSSEETIECCIKVFSKAEGVKMPLVNWGTIIKRLYNQTNNIKIKKHCIEFAAENISLSSLSIIVSEWLSVSQFKNSPTSIQKKLLKILPKVLNQLTPTRINSIFDDILLNISNQTIQIYKDYPITNLFLLWKILSKSLNQQDQDDDDEFNFNIKYSNEPLLNEIKEILFKFIIVNIRLLPSPFNNENELLSSENIKLLNIASESIFHLPKDKIQTHLPLLSGINDIDNEAKIQYLYVLALGKGSLGKASLSNFNKIKSWCFSSSDPTQQSKVLSILPLILTKPLIDNQVHFGFNSILNDVFDSISLTSKQHIIGLELLSQLISHQINLNVFEFNSFFNLYSNVNINSNQEDKDLLNIIYNFRYIELLPFYLKVLFNNYDNNQLDIQDIINRLITILQNKCSHMDNKVKSIIFSSILTLKQLNYQQSSQQQQQLSLFNLYKLLK